MIKLYCIILGYFVNSILALMIIFGFVFIKAALISLNIQYIGFFLDI